MQPHTHGATVRSIRGWHPYRRLPGRDGGNSAPSTLRHSTNTSRGWPRQEHPREHDNSNPPKAYRGP
jgi:hypothetical protein